MIFPDIFVPSREIILPNRKLILPRCPQFGGMGGLGPIAANRRRTNGGDPYFANVSLLCHMDGTNGGTSFPDNSNNAFTVTPSNCTTSTINVKYGTASALFGTISSLLTPNNSAFSFGTGDFTIEFWWYITGGTSVVLYDGRNGSNSDASPTLYTSGSSLLYQSTGTDHITGTTPSSTTWHFIAISRVSGTTRLFVDGTQSGSDYSDSTNYIQKPVTIGNYWAGGAGVVGNIDDLRITNGVGRYSSNFTPPTSAFPDF